MSKKSNNSTSRRWCFTWNNYEKHINQPSNLTMPDKGKFMIWQHERAPLTGTLHIQGYIELSSPVRYTHLTKIWPGVHVESAKGDANKNIEYCSKSESKIAGPWKLGEVTTQGQRSDLSEIADMLKSNSVSEVAKTFPENFIKYHNGIQKLKSFYNEKRNWKTIAEYHWGPTGTGKSKQAYERFPNAYYKPADNKWWDGYEGEETVIIDDWRGIIDTAYLLNLLDRYPMKIEMKGASTEFVSRRIIITSNKHFSEYCFRHEDLAPLERRFEIICEYSNNKSPIFTKNSENNDVTSFVENMTNSSQLRDEEISTNEEDNIAIMTSFNS